LLSLVHVLEWRAAVQPGAIALSDQQDADLASPAAADRPPPRPVDRLRPSGPAILVHTSGTTGRPKVS
jgi:acyl-coenzyme A synthetase/AMP-(fatty) acid ligase